MVEPRFPREPQARLGSKRRSRLSLKTKVFGIAIAFTMAALAVTLHLPPPSASEVLQTPVAKTQTLSPELTRAEKKARERAQGMKDIQKAASQVDGFSLLTYHQANTRLAYQEITKRGLDEELDNVSANIKKCVSSYILQTITIHESGGGNVEKFGVTGSSSAVAVFQIVLPQMVDLVKAYGQPCVDGVRELAGNDTADLLLKTAKEIKALDAGGLKELKKRVGFKKGQPYGPKDDPLAQALYRLASNTSVAGALIGTQLLDEIPRAYKIIRDHGSPSAKVLLLDHPETLVYAIHQFGMTSVTKLAKADPWAPIAGVLGRGVCEANGFTKGDPWGKGRVYKKGEPKPPAKDYSQRPVIDVLLEFFVKTVETGNTLKVLRGNDALKLLEAQKESPQKPKQVSLVIPDRRLNRGLCS